MKPIAGVEFLQGDFSNASVVRLLLDRLAGQAVDLVLSDMSPNLSGIGVSDDARAAALAEAVLEFSDQVLSANGDLLLKVFHGRYFEELRRQSMERFGIVRVRKPKASRPRSREVYLLARNSVV
jgi:23S rRNA (uridine2552-2'-O)-methyltransferase